MNSSQNSRNIDRIRKNLAFISILFNVIKKSYKNNQKAYAKAYSMMMNPASTRVKRLSNVKRPIYFDSMATSMIVILNVTCSISLIFWQLRTQECLTK